MKLVLQLIYYFTGLCLCVVKDITKMSENTEQFAPQVEDIEVQICTQDPYQPDQVNTDVEGEVAAEETITTDHPVILDEENPHIEYMTVVVDDSGEQLSYTKPDGPVGYTPILVKPNQDDEGSKDNQLSERQIADILVAAAGGNFASSDIGGSVDQSEECIIIPSTSGDSNEEPNAFIKFCEDMSKQSESGERRYRCGLCPKAYMDPTSLCKHRKVHIKDKPYKCKLCDRMFTDPSNMTRHAKTHLQEKPYHCETCSKSFSDLSNLNKHEKLHLNAKPYKCFVCQREFADSSNMRKHVKLHYGDRPFKCDVCGKAFADSSNLRKHKATHLEQKPYMCAVCQRTFADSSNLNKHMRIHEGTKPYQCEYCPKRFTDTSNLKKHTRIHTAEKPYVCGICGKKHSDKSNLTKHMKSHSDPSKTFMCGLCGRVFSSKKGVEMHAKSHTEEDSATLAVFTKEDEGKLIAISENTIHYLQAAGSSKKRDEPQIIIENHPEMAEIEVAEVRVGEDDDIDEHVYMIQNNIKQESMSRTIEEETLNEEEIEVRLDGRTVSMEEAADVNVIHVTI